MLPSSSEPELPLLIVVEGESDVHFLKAISTMLHRENAALPDLAQLTSERRAVFLPTGGSNLKEWMSRVSSLRKRAFYLFDREQEPETSLRRQLVDTINRRPGWYAGMSSKRALENYLHAQAIKEACGKDLGFDDNADVAGLLARAMMAGSGETAWHDLPCKRQKRLHERAKKTLNRVAVQHMTPARLAQQDHGGDIVTWLEMIHRMAQAGL